MAKLFLEVVTPDKVLVSQEADILVAPGSEGEFGILPGHVHFLSGLISGELRFRDGKDEKYLSVSTGFAEVSNDKISVLVDSAELSHDIDVERAKKSAERARERLSKEKGEEEIDFIRAEAALKRAISRIKLAEKQNI